jgi:diguanylate cyclase (GGDEF)-like protein/PAS domain S-box-containing protein
MHRTQRLARRARVLKTLTASATILLAGFALFPMLAPTGAPWPGSIVALALATGLAGLVWLWRDAAGTGAAEASRFEAAPAAIAVCDADDRILSANPALCALLGRSPDALTGVALDQLFEPATPTGQTPAPDTLRRAVRPDGQILWLRLARNGSTVCFLDETATQAALQTLAEEARQLQALLDILGEGVLVRGADGRTLRHNPAAARILGLSEGEMGRYRVDSGHVHYLHEDGSPCPPASLPVMQTLHDGRGHCGVVGVARRDGTTRWLWTHSQPIPGDDGRPGAVVTAMADLTHMRDAQTRLRLADRAIDHSAEAIMITTAEGRILRVNPAFTRVTGYSAEEAVGQSPALLRSGRHDPTFYAAMWAAIRDQGHWRGDIWNRRKDGGLFDEHLSISTVRDATGRPSHYVAVFSDVTDSRRLERQYAHMAHHDALTGLPNRVLMADRLAQALAMAVRNTRQVALMFVDLDHFKDINDAVGHAGGDTLLKAVADRLSACVRDSDSVGRQSGDEFLVLLPDLEDGGQAGQVAGKIQAALARPVPVDGHPVPVTASLGIALFPDDAHDAETLLAHADTALYHAKAAGRATFRYFTESMNAESERRLRLERELHVALERNALYMRYQPLQRLADGRIVAMEAVCQWKNALMGEIAPAQFLAPSGDLSLARAIDCWTLDQACHEAARWQAAGIGQVRVAVNIMARHFRLDSLVDSVRNALAQAGLAPDRLEIELTERVLHETDPVVGQTLRALKAMGVRLVLDEFGTGYNTLTRLKAAGIDRLKMDRSVLAHLDHSEAHLALMRAMVDLGRHLEIEVLADGLETERQHAHILAAGCALGQGSLLSAPMMPEDALTLLLASGRVPGDTAQDDLQR